MDDCCPAKLEPIPAAECPPPDSGDVARFSCDAPDLVVGNLCRSNAGECGTDKNLDNCEYPETKLKADIYRVIEARPVAPSPNPQPAITSSTSCGSIFARCTACSMACPSIAAPCVLLKPPRKDLARPVRAVEAMTTVRAAIGSETARRQRRSGKGCGDCGERGSASFLERCATLRVVWLALQ